MTTPRPIVHLVWFKRDLRLHDHAALHNATQRALASGSAVLPLYIVEPSVVQAADYDARHWSFTRESLIELRKNLRRLGQPLIVRVGEAVATLQTLSEQFEIAGLWAHEETGNDVTYQRDLAVIAWAKTRGIPFQEFQQNGVVRRLRDRDGWARRWDKRMSQPLAPAPEHIPPLPVDFDPGPIPTHGEINLTADPSVAVQAAGEAEAQRTLDSFFTERGAFYSGEMSSPVTAYYACSRLSPHLSYGTISMPTVFQATRARIAELKALSKAALAQLDAPWLRSLRAFESRLRWRDHFAQKLESEPEIEFHAFVRAFDALRTREQPGYEPRYAAWKAGQTGYPMVDACMRALYHTGWINFRMRAMVTSFGAYDLWLPWQDLSLWTAKIYTDYEPGIHYPQTQMQSGTTGINTLRIYNPTKQGRDHDPDGVFIRQWLPELEAVPDSFLQEPWKMPPMTQAAVGVRIGQEYPAPIVDHKEAAAAARDRLYELRSQPEIRAAAERVQQKHGSRKSGMPRTTKRASTRSRRESAIKEKDAQPRLL